MTENSPSLPRQSKAVGVARVTVTDNGRLVGRDAYTITDGSVLTELKLPLQYGGFFRHEIEVLIEFQPGVRPDA